MPLHVRSKPIYTAIGAPGTGKTQTLLSKLPALIEAGNRIVLALPTLVLSDDIGKRATEAGISYRTINQRSDGVVVSELEKALTDKNDSFILCMQESIRHVREEFLCDWVLVLDELPKVVDYWDYAFKPVELERVLQFTEEHNGQLRIKDNLDESLQDQVATKRADRRGMDSSTLGGSAANIFRMLLSGVEVFIDQPQSNNKRHIRAVEELFNWWKIIASAKECHVLAANIVGSEFELFAKVHGFRLEGSPFTPQPIAYSTEVIIYPVTRKGQKFSKKMMLSLHEGERVIDVIVNEILQHTHGTPLLFANKWSELQFRQGIQYIPKDCRGLNSYSKFTEAVILFGGNPSPSDSKGLDYLRMKYGEDFEEAFITTRLLEPSLQAVSRTAIRTFDETLQVHFYVQDERVVAYLQSNYFQHAKIDYSLAETLPVTRDGRQLDLRIEMEVNRLIAMGMKTLPIHRQTGVSPKKIRYMKERYKAA